MIHDKVKISDICNSYTRDGVEVARRWWSTCNPQKIRDAILLLTITEYGFNITVAGPAFKVEGEKNSFSEDAQLSIIRRGFGIGEFGPKDMWDVAFNGVKLASFDDPERAVDFFMATRMEKEIGHDMIDLHFSGHGGGPIGPEDE